MNTPLFNSANLANSAVLLALADAAIKSAALLVLAALAALLLRKASSAARHAVWCGALAGALLLPVLSFSLPAWRVPWLPEWKVEVKATEATEATKATEAQSQIISMVTNRENSEMSPSNPQPSFAKATEGTLATPSSQPETRNPKLETNFLKPQTYLLIWLLGLALSLIPLLAGWWQAARLSRRGRILDNPEWQTLLGEVSRTLGLQRKIKLLAASGSVMPFTWGAWRPAVVFPESAEQWPLARRRLVLLHELGHVKRHDWLTQTLGALACALYWFNPLAWLAARQLRLEREQACDDLVLRCGSAPNDYARELLEIAAQSARSRVLNWVAVPVARPGKLEIRLRAILDGSRNRRTLTRAALLGLAGLFAAIVIPMAMLKAADAEKPETAPTSNATTASANTTTTTTTASNDANNQSPNPFDPSAPQNTPTDMSSNPFSAATQTSATGTSSNPFDAAPQNATSGPASNPFDAAPTTNSTTPSRRAQDLAVFNQSPYAAAPTTTAPASPPTPTSAPDQSNSVTFIVTIKHSDVQDVVSKLKSIRPPGLENSASSFTTDARTNTIVVVTEKENEVKIRQMIADLDVASVQIQVELKLLEIPDALKVDLKTLNPAKIDQLSKQTGVTIVSSPKITMMNDTDAAIKLSTQQLPIPGKIGESIPLGWAFPLHAKTEADGIDYTLKATMNKLADSKADAVMVDSKQFYTSGVATPGKPVIYQLGAVTGKPSKYVMMVIFSLIGPDGLIFGNSLQHLPLSVVFTNPTLVPPPPGAPATPGPSYYVSGKGVAKGGRFKISAGGAQTVAEAVQLAGTDNFSKLNAVRLIRDAKDPKTGQPTLDPNTGQPKMETKFVDVEDILKNGKKDTDVVLQDGDWIIVDQKWIVL